ncbi:tail fiber [Stenotrophomonas phage Silvanus]|nr:tail fiber [Stenotrophomonas phage Silvanus]
MTIEKIDQTTPYPDGSFGDDAFVAFGKVNNNFDAQQADIEAEQQARAQADSALSTRIDGLPTNANLQAEVTARTNADNALGQRITTEIGAEATARADADNALSQAIAEEVIARQNADTALGARFIGKNVVINGDFRFWQRGTGFNLAGYGADRFLNNISGITCSMTRLALAVGEIAGFKYACRMSFNAGSDPAHYATLQHRVENLGYYSGKTLTFSGYMRANTAGLKVAFEVALGAGGGTIPGAVPVSGIGVQTFTLGTAWQRFTATFTVPSLVGASLTDNSSLNFNLWLSAGSSHNSRNNNLGFQSGIVDFVGLQLEDGGTATIFEYRPDALELALCQRYYEKSYNIDTLPATVTGVGQTAFFQYGLPSANYAGGMTTPFKVTKRSTPSVTLFSPLTGASGKIQNAGNANDVNGSVTDIGQSEFFAQSVGFGPTNTINLRWHWTADAEL